MTGQQQTGRGEEPKAKGEDGGGGGLLRRGHGRRVTFKHGNRGTSPAGHSPELLFYESSAECAIR